ncbi:hypothetical protein PVAP13_7KG156220 [Panicum virgatum]|uniref:Uncharacterized protein n=1 Tax=Panicum virgatum TaxID=38727 RepID=A0A8T0QMA6_PANVG|nr:hypothetical protein PVAP13_7KG156220 [Panicum virgatum]
MLALLADASTTTIRSSSIPSARPSRGRTRRRQQRGCAGGREPGKLPWREEPAGRPDWGSRAHAPAHPFRRPRSPPRRPGHRHRGLDVSGSLTAKAASTPRPRPGRRGLPVSVTAKAASTQQPRPQSPPRRPRRRHRGLDVSGSLTTTAKTQVIECTARPRAAPRGKTGKLPSASARRAAGKLAMITALRVRDDTARPRAAPRGETG